MPVLLLARGDQNSRTLLRHAIEARYGLGPPALETLKLELKGRTRATLGPLSAWVPLEGIAYFKFPFSVRWNFTTRPVGIAFEGGADSFDGAVCRQRRRNQVTVIDDAQHIAAARARLWAINALLLMPLSEQFVELRATGERSLDAVNSDYGITTHLQLHEDHTLDFTSTECLNPATGKQQMYSARLSEGQKVIGDVMLPGKIAVYWDDHVALELSPVAAECNLPMDESLFKLESE